MKKHVSLILLAMLLLATKTEAQNTRILILVPNKYGANYYLERDDYENFGWEVTTASVTKTVIPCQDYAGPLGCPVITVDTLVSQIQNIGNWDILVVTQGGGGNNACSSLINSPATLKLVQDAVDSGLVVGAMCSGVRVLAAAGVINGIHVTSNLNDSAYCTNAGAIHVGICAPPVIDGNFVTSSIGDYYHIQNTEALMRAFSANLKKKIPEQPVPGLISHSLILDTHSSVTDSMIITSFGGVLSDGGRSLCKTSDGGYLVTGFTCSSGEGYADAILLKIGADGNQQWSKTVGGALPDYANSAIETSDGHYLVCGYTYSTGAGSADVMVIKTDTIGRVIWSKTYGGPEFETGKSVCETSGGNYLVCGYTESFGNGKDDIYLIGLDTAGNLQWQKTYGNIESDMGNAVIESSDGNYIIAGNAGNRTPNPGYGWWGDRDACLLKIDVNGDLMWEKRYNTSIYQQWGNAVTETFDHHFMIAGNNDITNSELLDVYLVKTDSTGLKNWAKSYGEGTFYDYGNAILPTSDSCFLVCGTSKSIANGDDAYYLKIDRNGTVLNKKIIGQEGFDWGNAVCTSGNDTAIAGLTNSYGNGKYDILFIRLTNSVSPGIDHGNRMEQPTRIINFSPNPFSNSAALHLFISGDDSPQLRIVNLYGQVIRTFEKPAPGDQIIIWDGKDDSNNRIGSGTYLINLQSETGVQARKIICIQ